MNSNAKMKKNHWVPQSYLRTFAANAAENSKIWRMSKEDYKGSPELKPIEKVAVKFYLYAPNQNGKRSYEFEKKLSDLEQLFGLEGWRKISGGWVDLNHVSIRKGIGLLAAVMFMRTPKSLDLFKKIHKTIIAQVLSQSKRPTHFLVGNESSEIDWSDWNEFQTEDESSTQKSWIESVENSIWLAEKFMKMRWAVVASEYPVFITSDNPVSMINSQSEPYGFDSADTTVMFPLGPKRLLIMDNRHREPNGEYYAPKDHPYWNMLVWKNSIEYMFSSRNPDEVCVEINDHASRLGF